MGFRAIKVKASSLPQVVTAMALLGVIVGITIMVFSNVLSDSSSLMDKQMSNMLDKHVNKVFEEKRFNDDSFEYEGYTVEIEFSDYVLSERLKVGYFSAFVNGEEKSRFEKRILIMIGNEEE